MTTGSLCLTEILKSRKSCSSNRAASFSADSTSASGVALPYFASSRLSSEPALTPIRSDVPAAAAALAISPTRSSKALMLPGLTRTAAHPASMAANTYLGWKWMSAITGICDFVAIAGSASASSCDGTATRTMSQPDAVSSAICCRVALMSAVSVVVIDCTDTGASPPTATEPTLIWRDLRRSARTGGGAVGMPSDTGVVTAFSIRHAPARPPSGSRADGDGLDDVGVDDEQGQHDQHRRHGVHDRQHLRGIDVNRRSGPFDLALVATAHAYACPVAQPGPAALGCLDECPRDMPAVQGQQRQQVEEEQQQVHGGQQLDQEEDLVLRVDPVSFAYFTFSTGVIGTLWSTPSRRIVIVSGLPADASMMRTVSPQE